MVRKTFHAICLKPKSLFHFGEGSSGVKEITPFPHSDTIFSAFCHSYLQLFGKEELEKLLHEFIDGNPPFLVSSAFPVYNAVQKIYFFPKPCVMPASKIFDEDFWDFWKKASYLSKSVFEHFLVNGIHGVESEFRNGHFHSKGKVILSEGELQTIDKDYESYGISQLPRNMIRRLSKPETPSTLVYYVVVTAYKNAGIYLLFDAIREPLGIIEKVFNLLRDEGIGGMRTLGYGAFEFSVEELNIVEAEDSEAFVTLSLFHPSEDETKTFIQKPQLLGYHLLTRGGYVFSPLIRSRRLKQTLKMMSEGSILPKIENRKLYGGFPKVLHKNEENPHDVFRYGYAFPLSVKV
jgi:CRISPR-associated protein Csm4